MMSVPAHPPAQPAARPWRRSAPAWPARHPPAASRNDCIGGQPGQSLSPVLKLLVVARHQRLPASKDMRNFFAARPSPLSRSSGRDRRRAGSRRAGCRGAPLLRSAGRAPECPPLEKLQGFGADLEGLEDALGKHHHLGPMLEEFLDVGGLDPGAVAGAGLLPVPRAPAARPELRVLEAAPAFDLDATPRRAA
jgi:hypothetical protein